MTKAAFQRQGRPATDLLEESVRLLRRAPASALLAYFTGSVPCMLAALYFVADMSRSAYAGQRLLESAAAMAAAYAWMKCWQAVFTRRLTAELLLEQPPHWALSRIARMAAAQIALQPAGLILRPAAMVLAIPTIWTATFFQNLTVLGDGTQRGLSELARRAYAQCRLWPLQAHVAATLLLVFGFFVWLNVCTAMVAVPFALKIFFGIETAFSKHLTGLLNPTFFAASFAAVYLCLDPIRKAFCVLRCFHGDSLRTGADLDVQLKRIRLARPMATAAAVLLGLSAVFRPMHAVAAMKEAPKVNAQELNRSLDDVLERREYAWRAPRDRKPLPEVEESWFARLRKSIDQWLERMWWKIGNKIRHWLSDDSKPSSNGSHDWLSMISSVRFLFFVLLGVSAVLLAILVMRARRRIPVSAARAETAAPRPDLAGEDVTADQLPEDGWLQLAGELIQRGDLRLALRASYLASLAHLGQREFIRLAKYKSNRDYDRELRRRARGQGELLAAFDRNLESFERGWYGEHPVTSETLHDFSENLQTIRTC